MSCCEFIIVALSFKGIQRKYIVLRPQFPHQSTIHFKRKELGNSPNLAFDWIGKKNCTIHSTSWSLSPPTCPILTQSRMWQGHACSQGVAKSHSGKCGRLPTEVNLNQAGCSTNKYSSIHHEKLLRIAEGMSQSSAHGKVPYRSKTFTSCSLSN